MDSRLSHLSKLSRVTRVARLLQQQKVAHLLAHRPHQHLLRPQRQSRMITQPLRSAQESVFPWVWQLSASWHSFSGKRLSKDKAVKLEILVPKTEPIMTSQLKSSTRLEGGVQLRKWTPKGGQPKCQSGHQHLTIGRIVPLKNDHDHCTLPLLR